MKGSFTKVQNKLILSNLKDLDFRVMCYLLARSKDGQCFPSMPRIAEDLKKSRETIRASIERLVKGNYITKENRYLGKGKKTSNLYIISKEYIQEKTKKEIYQTAQIELEDYDWLGEEE